MNLPVIGTVMHAPYQPVPADAPHLPADGWGPPVAVPLHGWWPTAADEQIIGDAGRRALEVERAVIVPASTVCGDRDRWTLTGGVFEQIGGPADYNNGPFGTEVPLVVYLKRVEG